MATQAERDAIIVEANRRAITNGTTPELELWKFAQSIGYSPSQIDDYMGWPAGTSQKWAVQKGLIPAPNQPASPINQAPAQQAATQQQQTSSTNPYRSYVDGILNNSALSVSDKANLLKADAARLGMSAQQYATATGYSLEQVNQAFGLASSAAPAVNAAGVPLKVDANTLATYNEFGSTNTFYKADANGTEWIYDENGNLLNGVKVAGNTNQYFDRNGGLVSTGQRGTNEGISGLTNAVKGVINDPTFWQTAAIAAGTYAAGNGLFGAATAGAGAANPMAIDPATAAATGGTAGGTIATAPGTAATVAATTPAVTTPPATTTVAPPVTNPPTNPPVNVPTNPLTDAGIPTWLQPYLPGLLTAAGGIVSGQSAVDAARAQADAQVRAAQIAADAAKFKPVGVTTNFGSSQFGYDSKGNLVSAGYQLAPGLQAAIGTLGGQAQGLLDQAGRAQTATAPLGNAAQATMAQGQGLLGVGGNLVNEAGAYKMSPQQVQAATAPIFQAGANAIGQGQNMMGVGSNLFNQAQQYNLSPAQVQAMTAPAFQAGQQAMNLGQGYLTTDPKAQAAKYYADQMALLAPTRAADMAALQAQMQAQGRGGFAIGGGVGGQGAANPQLQAMLNAQMQQNNQIAADATRGGMDYANFGAGMVNTGTGLLNAGFGTQTAAMQPYQAALNNALNVTNAGVNTVGAGSGLYNQALANQVNSMQPYQTALGFGMDTLGKGAQLAGTGANLLTSMYNTQNAAYQPLNTVLGTAGTIEGMGQNALTLGMQMGNTVTAANANAGGLLSGGLTNAAATQARADSFSPWGAALSGLGQATQGYRYDPMTGKPISSGGTY